MDDKLKKYYKKAFKDIESVKDIISEMTEMEPKTINEMKKRLSKRVEKD